jgi:hypoxanthine phosphoribosyltransferase
MSRDNLFQGEFLFLHSGDPTDFKIECDALTDEDIKQLAKIIGRRLEFSEVYGIPRGGERLAQALKQYETPATEIENREGYVFGYPPDHTVRLLIVDDVLTTGNSFRAAHGHCARTWKGEIIGVCIFCRQPEAKPDWVHAVFSMW